MQSRTAESQQIAEQAAPVVSVPTPWKLGAGDWLSHSCCFDAVVVGYRDGSCTPVAEVCFPDDASLIVRAVNSHEALVKALEKAEELYQVGIMNAPDELCDEVVQLRRAALASAREVQP